MTGASEGLGLAAAKQLAAKGANIVLVSRSIDKLQAALEDVKVRSGVPPPIPRFVLTRTLCTECRNQPKHAAIPLHLR